jgi:hypothetical protein
VAKDYREGALTMSRSCRPEFGDAYLYFNVICGVFLNETYKLDTAKKPD